VKAVLDSGALIALERRPGALLSDVRDLALHGGGAPVVPATVVAQVWRSGAGRQAPLAAFLGRCRVGALDASRAREVGQLLAASGTDDIADAHVVVAAESGDLIITSDPLDIATLARAAGKQVAIIAI
jgi:hypothetical protein